MTSERIQWHQSDGFIDLGKCIPRISSDRDPLDSSSWGGILSLINILLPETGERLKQYLPCNSIATYLLQQKNTHSQAVISLETIFNILCYLSDEGFLRSLKIHHDNDHISISDLLVEVRLGLLAIIHEYLKEEAPSMFYRFIRSMLTVYGKLTLLKLCEDLFLPIANIDEEVFGRFLVAAGSILSPNLLKIDTETNIIEVAILRTVFAFILLHYGATPPVSLRHMIYSDLFLLTSFPYQFLSPNYFCTYLCNLLEYESDLSLSLKTMIGELVLDILSFELRYASERSPPDIYKKMSLEIDSVYCDDLLQATDAIPNAELPKGAEALNSLGLPIALLSLSVFPCLPDYVVAKTHLSAPFVELSILATNFTPQSFLSQNGSRNLFAVFHSAAFNGEVIEYLKTSFMATVSKHIDLQSSLLAARFPFFTYKPNILDGKLVQIMDESSRSLCRFRVTHLLSYLSSLVVEDLAASPITLINIESPDLFATLFTNENQVNIGELYYSQTSPCLGRISYSNFWNFLLLTKDAEIPFLPLIPERDQVSFKDYGSSVSDVFVYMLNLTTSRDESKGVWLEKMIAYITKTYTDDNLITQPEAIISLNMLVFFLFSVTMTLQYLQFQPKTSITANDKDLDGLVTPSSFLDFISCTWVSQTDPIISSILLLESYSCDVQEKGPIVLSIESFLHTIYPISNEQLLKSHEEGGSLHLNITKSPIKIVKRGTIPPILVSLVLLYIIVPDAFPSFQQYIGYILALALNPTYQTLLILLASVSAGTLGTFVMSHGNRILIYLYELSSQRLTKTTAAKPKKMHFLIQALDKYLILLHLLTLYASLLVSAVVFELTFFTVNSELKVTNLSLHQKNIGVFLIQHLLSLSNIYFISVVTTRRLCQVLKDYALQFPSSFECLADTYTSRLSCSYSTMQQFLSIILKKWAHFSYVGATIRPCVFFISMLNRELGTNPPMFSIEPDQFDSLKADIFRSIEQVVDYDCFLSELNIPNVPINLLSNLLFMAYNITTTSRLIVDSLKREIESAYQQPETNGRITCPGYYHLDFNEVHLEDLMLQIFVHFLTTLASSSFGSVGYSSAKQIFGQNEPLLKHSKPDASQASVWPSSYLNTKHILYIQLAELSISLCTRLSSLYQQWRLSSTQILDRQIFANIASSASRTIDSLQRLVLDNWLLSELSSFDSRIRNMLGYDPFSPYNPSQMILHIKPFISLKTQQNLDILASLNINNINWLERFCTFWQLLISGAQIALSITKGVDCSHLGTIPILSCGDFNLSTFCLLRGLLLKKILKQKSSVRSIVSAHIHRCSDLKYGNSFVPLYVPAWQPSFSETVAKLQINFVDILEDKLSMSRLDLPIIIAEFADVKMHSQEHDESQMDSSTLCLRDNLTKILLAEKSQPSKA